jgi:hypothetical protein
MHLSLRLLLAVGCILPAACATPGGGPLGLVMFDSNHHVSAAEPLFGKNDMQCLDDPTFLLTLYGPDPLVADNCTKMRSTIAVALQPMTILDGTKARYGKVQRNEVIDGLMAASDRKCGRYIAFLQQYDANVNSTFGIAAQAAATIAAITTGGTAEALAAAASIAGGTRNTLNQSHFNNQTVGVLANAFENLRREQREKIAELQNKPPEEYTLMRGLQDATRYHANCSIVVGLKEAQRAVEEAHAPSLNSMEKMLEHFAKLQVQAEKAGLTLGKAKPVSQTQTVVPATTTTTTDTPEPGIAVPAP